MLRADHLYMRLGWLVTVAAVVSIAIPVGVPTAGQLAIASSHAGTPAAARSADTRGMTPTRNLQPRAPSSNRLPGTRCQVFPADNWWHADVSSMPVDARSDAWLSASEAASTNLHPDFGPSFGEQPVPYGIPITVVRPKKPGVRVAFEYADESDNVRYPLTRRTAIEGGWSASGDRHAIVVNAKTCGLYETWNTRLTRRGWTAGSGATWSLRNNRLRPSGWTSADAAGLPILPGLLRWDEIQRGEVDHAIRFTVPDTADAFLWPARHRAGSGDAATVPPMGARFRMKSTFSTAGFSAQAQVVLAAMKRHGMVVADNGSAWFFQGTADDRWPDELISELKTIPAAAFEAVDTSSLKITDNSARVRN